MSVAIVTGSAGLIGSEAVTYFASWVWTSLASTTACAAEFFGEEASTAWVRDKLETEIPNIATTKSTSATRKHVGMYSSDYGKRHRVDHSYSGAAVARLGCAQSNVGLHRQRERYLRVAGSHPANAPEAVFIFTSTNKVYGDTPNCLPLVEHETRWEIDRHTPTPNGIPETMSIDHTVHSLFGVSKVAADVLVQEYGRYFGMKTACFRGGCLTGPNHSGTQLHGFLAYLMKCAVTGTPYSIFGYKGKQVRDNIHSHDLIRAFHEFFKNPRRGEVYNIGGGALSNCSMLEAIITMSGISGNQFHWTLRRREPPRRPHLVDQRSVAIPAALPEVEITIRRSANFARNLRIQSGALDPIMRDARKRNVLGIMMDAVDYQKTMNFIFEAASEKRGAAISALAVHGLMTGAIDREQKFRLNHFDMLLPDGQPVRWALNLLYNAQLRDRVYGPKLTGKICERAAAEGVPVYFYGSTPETLSLLRKRNQKDVSPPEDCRDGAIQVPPSYH